MKPKFGREMVLLTLPVLLVSGWALWNAKMDSGKGRNELLGLYSGASRLELTNWTREKLWALDYAEGKSSRWIVTAWIGGECSTGMASIALTPKPFVEPMHFAWKRRGIWQQTLLDKTRPSYRLLTQGSKTIASQDLFYFDLPLHLVPRDAESLSS